MSVNTTVKPAAEVEDQTRRRDGSSLGRAGVVLLASLGLVLGGAGVAAAAPCGPACQAVTSEGPTFDNPNSLELCKKRPNTITFGGFCPN